MSGAGRGAHASHKTFSSSKLQPPKQVLALFWKLLPGPQRVRVWTTERWLQGWGRGGVCPHGVGLAPPSQTWSQEIWITLPFQLPDRPGPLSRGQS